ncbi:MAG TPA: DUF2306 domain-containing protein [Puia sp.]|nr:DUF2306 domain-containing protein [Puia sp.]
MNDTKTINRISRLLRVAMFTLAAIAIAMVVRRVLTMEGLIPVVTPRGGPPFDTGFGKHPVITFLHILPGALFMILGPMQFMPGVRSRSDYFHRRSLRVFLVCAYIVGFSALIMPFVMLPIGGVNEAAGSILFALFFLVSLTKAWRYMVKKNLARHREWMIRAFAIGLAIATIRPIIGLFFAFSGLPPQVFFGTAFWIGFTLHLITAETWINYTRDAVQNVSL